MAENSKKSKNAFWTIESIKLKVELSHKDFLLFFVLKSVESIVKCSVCNRNFNFDLLQRKDKENKKKKQKSPNNCKLSCETAKDSNAKKNN